LDFGQMVCSEVDFLTLKNTFFVMNNQKMKSGS